MRLPQVDFQTRTHDATRNTVVRDPDGPSVIWLYLRRFNAIRVESMNFQVFERARPPVLLRLENTYEASQPVRLEASQTMCVFTCFHVYGQPLSVHRLAAT